MLRKKAVSRLAAGKRVEETWVLLGVVQAAGGFKEERIMMKKRTREEMIEDI